MTGRRMTNLKGVAEYLNMSAELLRKRIKAGTIDIPHFKFSDRTYMFDLDEVDAWLAKGREQGHAAWMGVERQEMTESVPA